MLDLADKSAYYVVMSQSFIYPPAHSAECLAKTPKDPSWGRHDTLEWCRPLSALEQRGMIDRGTVRSQGATVARGMFEARQAMKEAQEKLDFYDEWAKDLTDQEFDNFIAYTSEAWKQARWAFIDEREKQ